MRQLSMCTRLLAVVLLALGVRLVIARPTPVTALTATIIASLLIASLVLARHGRSHHPPSRPPAPTGRH